jgi:hypothetical protein
MGLRPTDDNENLGAGSVSDLVWPSSLPSLDLYQQHISQQRRLPGNPNKFD